MKVKNYASPMGNIWHKLGALEGLEIGEFSGTEL